MPHTLKRRLCDWRGRCGKGDTYHPLQGYTCQACIDYKLPHSLRCQTLPHKVNTTNCPNSLGNGLLDKPNMSWSQLWVHTIWPHKECTETVQLDWKMYPLDKVSNLVNLEERTCQIHTRHSFQYEQKVLARLGKLYRNLERLKMWMSPRASWPDTVRIELDQADQKMW